MTSGVGVEKNVQDTPGGDRVREHTDPKRLEELDAELWERVERYRHASADELDARIAELEQTSDMERVLETNASILALSGLIAGMTVNRRFLVLPGVVLSFLLQHAIQGWCPPVPVLRRLGIRTRQEIDAERYALKAMRGDLDEFCGHRS